MIALLPILAAVTCAGCGGLALGLSRAPGWAVMRPIAAALFSGAGYAVTEALTTGRHADVVHLAAGQASLIFATLHGLAWLRVLAVADGARTRVLERLCLLALVPALVPGLTHRAPILERALPALAITYRDATPTAPGLALFAAQMALLCWIAARFVRRGRPGEALVAAALAGLVGASLLDSASTLGLLPLPYLTASAYGLLWLVAGVHVARRFSLEAGRLQALAQGLDARVEAQSRALVQARVEVARAERQRAVGELAAGVAQATLPMLARSARLVEALDPQDFRSPAARALALGRVEAARAALSTVARVGGDLLAASRIAAAGDRPPTTAAVALLRGAVARVQARLPKGTNVRLEADDALLVFGAPELLLPAVSLAVARVGAELAPGEASLELCARAHDGRVELVVGPGRASGDDATGVRVIESSFATRAPALGWGAALGLLRSQGGSVEEARTPGGALRLTISLAVA